MEYPDDYSLLFSIVGLIVSVFLTLSIFICRRNDEKNLSKKRKKQCAHYSKIMINTLQKLGVTIRDIDHNETSLLYLESILPRYVSQLDKTVILFTDTQILVTDFSDTETKKYLALIDFVEWFTENFYALHERPRYRPKHWKDNAELFGEKINKIISTVN